MTKDDIIRMAREAGGTAYTNRHFPGETAMAFGPQALERFAKLVVKHNEEVVIQAISDGIVAEREACAKLCEDFDVGVLVLVPITRGRHVLANAIRARGQQ